MVSVFSLSFPSFWHKLNHVWRVLLLMCRINNQYDCSQLVHLSYLRQGEVQLVMFHTLIGTVIVSMLHECVSYARIVLLVASCSRYLVHKRRIFGGMLLIHHYITPFVHQFVDGRWYSFCVLLLMSSLCH